MSDVAMPPAAGKTHRRRGHNFAKQARALTGLYVVKRKSAPPADQRNAGQAYARNSLGAFRDTGSVAARTDFFRYTSRLMDELSKGDWDQDAVPAPSAISIDRGRILLRQIARPSSIYPSVAPDGDGGIDIQWTADSKTLHLNITSSGEVYASSDPVFAKIPVGTLMSTDRDNATLIKALAELTAYVERRNPGWRRWFRH